MQTVNVFEAKTNLSKLIQRVENGEEIIIARAGKPAVKMTQISDKKKRPPIRYGILKGKLWVADDFDAPLPDEVLAGFEGR